MKSSLSASPSFYASQSPVCSGSRFSTCPGKEERSPKEEAEEVVKADGKGIGFSARDIFGPVPSKEEAESAVSALQQICVPKNFSKLGEDEAACFTRDSFDPALLMLQKERSTSLPDSCLDLTKPRHQAYKLNSVLSEMQNKLFDSLQLLRLNPSVQRMVVSLASDKDVWESIMKNERVQELKRSYCADKYIQYTTGGIKTEFSAGYPYIVAQILGWVFENAKGKVMQIIEDILSLIIDLFHSRGKENGMEVVSDVVRSSFMLSVLVLIIVILKRADDA